jgi:hypothetical protein
MGGSLARIGRDGETRAGNGTQRGDLVGRPVDSRRPKGVSVRVAPPPDSR